MGSSISIANFNEFYKQNIVLKPTAVNLTVTFLTEDIQIKLGILMKNNFSDKNVTRKSKLSQLKTFS